MAAWPVKVCKDCGRMVKFTPVSNRPGQHGCTRALAMIRMLSRFEAIAKKLRNGHV